MIPMPARETTCATVAHRKIFCSDVPDGIYAVIFSSDLVSFPAAVTVKVCPASDMGAVKESVSLFVPVYPLTVTPSGRDEVSSVYPLLMLTSFTWVEPVNTS